MSHNQVNPYDVESHVAEVYDLTITYVNDVDLIRCLISERGPLRILEPFCGTGRILISLAMDGHELVGLDQAKGMLARARGKVACLPDQVRGRITLAEADVTQEPWPGGFDLVILGGNCLYELATGGEQEGCIASAATALFSGGHVYVDNDHMEGDLDPSWRTRCILQGTFPTGSCADGILLESTRQAIWWDAPRRLIRFRRQTRARFPDGRTAESGYVQQKHPVSKGEVQAWLEAHGFTVERLYGDLEGNPYTEASGRAIFWARKC